MPKFVEDHDAQRMLSNSIISLGGRLVYVVTVMDRILHGTDVETGEAIAAPADFDTIKNPSEGRLGYHNGRWGTSYIVRTPARITTMGLCRGNLKFMAVHNSEERGGPTSFAASLFKSIHNTYNNIFPSFDAAYERAVEKGIPTAFDRSFAIDRLGRLYFKGKNIGKANPRGEEFSVLTEYGKAVQCVRNVPKLKWR